MPYDKPPSPPYLQASHHTARKPTTTRFHMPGPDKGPIAGRGPR